MSKFLKTFSALFILLILPAIGLWAQRIIYTQPDKEEPRQTNFEIIGKYDNQFLIYKSIRNKAYISVYDNDLKLVANNNLEFMPDKVIEADFVSFPEFSYLFYQFQKRSVVYCMMVKIGPDGKNLSQPIEIDTTQVGMGNNSRIYSVITSEDKQRIQVLKINTKDERRYQFKTLLYNKSMDLIRESRLALPMNDRNDFLTDFLLDNEGNLVFGRGLRPGASENITKFWLISKPAQADSFSYNELKLDNISLDEIKLRMDNNNNRYLFTGFYYKGKRAGSIVGITNAIFDKGSSTWVIKNIIPLDEELRADAKGENNIRNAFDDYYIKEIFIQRDGGFVTVAESAYQTARGGNMGFNRWNNFYGPSYMNSFDYYRYSGMGPYGFNRWGGNSLTRYHADNIVVCAFDKDGNLTLSNTIRKSQFDDENDAMVSYQVINSGGSLKFLYNDYEKRDVLLAYQSIDINGKVTRPPTLKNLDQGYKFIPRFAKQVSGRVVIIPTLYRNFLTFAKLEF